MHTWKFYRSGGLDQVLFRNGADIAHLAELDQKLWTALSCPTKGIRFDTQTLNLLDTDKDGRIRVPELLAAVKWLSVRLVSLDPLMEGSDTLRLASISTSTPEGLSLLASAKRILANLDKASADAISLADVGDTAKIFAGTRFNGDGIVPVDAADDPATQQIIAEIIAAFGAETDRSGKPGVNQAKVDAFFGTAAAYLDWTRRANAEVLPLGDKTATAAAALEAVRAKLDDYFTRCGLSAFDARAAGPLSRTDADFAALADKNLTVGMPALAAFPLSKIAAGRDLPMIDGVNPYWSAALKDFKAAVVEPLVGPGCLTLSEGQWQALKAMFAPYAAWIAAKTGAEVASLGAARLAVVVAGQAKADITALIARDAALATENAQITEVERLIRYQANLLTLISNYVNMGRLYDPKTLSIFQVGTLYMDARACNLCFHVDDIAAHSSQADASKCCLAYCILSRPATKETRTICATFTSGFAHSLWVGRNGIFYDLDGKDWDAVIVKMVDNSISLKEAFWDPWRKIAAMIGGQVRKMLSAKQDAALVSAAKKIEAPGAVAAEAPKKMEGAALASTAAALGIAVGLISTAIGGMVSAVAGLPLWKSALGLVAILLMVSGPSMILTWFKLRARDVAPILNACGWAINRRLRLSLKLGRLFTTEAVLPAHAECQLTDPFADDNTVRNRIVAAVILVALALALWFAGLLDSVLPDAMKRIQTGPGSRVTAEAPPAPKDK
ncbi:MAG: hypothetical protein FJ222_05125 [Lentisphaerae bacterium]|nr:hypothetical protein [Lentisphaerota bacterium]